MRKSSLKGFYIHHHKYHKLLKMLVTNESHEITRMGWNLKPWSPDTGKNCAQPVLELGD